VVSTLLKKEEHVPYSAKPQYVESLDGSLAPKWAKPNKSTQVLPNLRLLHPAAAVALEQILWVGSMADALDMSLDDLITKEQALAQPRPRMPQPSLRRRRTRARAPLLPQPRRQPLSRGTLPPAQLPAAAGLILILLLLID
jgi:hypothetical protein